MQYNTWNHHQFSYMYLIFWGEKIELSLVVFPTFAFTQFKIHPPSQFCLSKVLMANCHKIIDINMLSPEAAAEKNDINIDRYSLFCPSHGA